MAITQLSPRLSDPAAKSGQPITEMVNAGFAYLPQVCLVFSKKLSQFTDTDEKFVDL
jgi:hypothetical protein